MGGMQLRRLKHLPPTAACFWRVAHLPRTLMRRVLDFAVAGPTVERPCVWQRCWGDPDDAGIAFFPTLSDHVHHAADRHSGDAFAVGLNNKALDTEWNFDRRNWERLRQQELQMEQQSWPEKKKRKS